VSEKDYIEVAWYVCGVYLGKHKVGKNSICGALLSDNFFGASKQIKQMTDEINEIIKGTESAQQTPPQAQEDNNG
jgi:hypothetical protein